MSRMRLPRALQTRLLVLVLGTSMLVWLVAAAAAWMDASHELDELLDGHLAQSAALLMVQAGSDQFDDDDIADAPSLHRYAPQAAFQVYVDGDLVVRSGNVGVQPMSPQPRGFSTVQDAQGQRWRVFAAHSGAGNVAVYVGEELASRQSILWAVMRSMFWPLAVALPLLGALGWWSIRTGLAPLHALSQALRQRPPQATEPVTLAHMPPELVPLVEALNALLGRLGRMLASERRFTADAAHELRTPIAAIRAQAQVALGAGDNQPERQRALHATLAGCDRATRLVEQLLTLARLEATPSGAAASTAHGSPAPAAPATVPNAAPCAAATAAPGPASNPAQGAAPTVTPKAAPTADLRTVATRVAAELAGAALARKQELSLDAPTPAWVHADEVLLGVLVRNLLDNALRYSPEGAQVRLAVVADAHGVLLRVDDSGPGLSPEALARLGERFFRVLGSDQPGSGLGWSIVRRLADVFGATVLAAPSAQLGGLAVTVRWASAS